MVKNRSSRAVLGRLLASVVVSAAALVGASPALADDPVRISVGIDPAYSPIFLAKTADLFGAAGVKANVIQYAQGGEGVDAILAGQIDIAGSTEATFLNRSTRGDVKALAVFSQSGRFIKLVARKGITEVSQIKKYGIVPGSVNEYATSKLLAKNNIDPKTVEFVKGGPPEFPALLARGDIDAYVMWEPWPTRGVAAGGSILGYSGDFGYVYNLLLLAPGAWVAAHPKEAHAVVDAVAKACEQITADITKAGAATQTEAKIPSAQSVELLKDVQCKVRDFTPADIANYNDVADFLFSRKIVTKKPEVEKNTMVGFYKP